MKNIEFFKNEEELLKGIEDFFGCECTGSAKRTVQWLFKEHKEIKAFELPHWFVKGALISILDYGKINIGIIDVITRSGNTLKVMLKGGETYSLKKFSFDIEIVRPIKLMPWNIEDAKTHIGLPCISPSGVKYILDHIEVLLDRDYYHLTDANNEELSIVEDFNFKEWKTMNGEPCGQYVVDYNPPKEVSNV